MTSKDDSEKCKKKPKREKSSRKSLHKTETFGCGSAEERADVAFLKWHVEVKQRACCELNLRVSCCACVCLSL
jgi:hypothetical protein